jgi:hypothetical protein
MCEDLLGSCAGTDPLRLARRGRALPTQPRSRHRPRHRAPAPPHACDPSHQPRDVEALYDQPRQLDADDEGHEMRRLRAEMHRHMLGNGYCARPVEMDCHFESICESCAFFVTTIEFRPTLQHQRDDAADKGQVGRQKIFDGLLERLDEAASTRPPRDHVAPGA